MFTFFHCYFTSYGLFHLFNFLGLISLYLEFSTHLREILVQLQIVLFLFLLRCVILHEITVRMEIATLWVLLFCHYIKAWNIERYLCTLLYKAFLFHLTICQLFWIFVVDLWRFIKVLGIILWRRSQCIFTVTFTHSSGNLFWVLTLWGVSTLSLCRILFHNVF